MISVIMIPAIMPNNICSFIFVHFLWKVLPLGLMSLSCSLFKFSF
jgi:hypothetical protein